jgi:hypothetical protein
MMTRVWCVASVWSQSSSEFRVGRRTVIQDDMCDIMLGLGRCATNTTGVIRLGGLGAIELADIARQEVKAWDEHRVHSTSEKP